MFLPDVMVRSSDETLQCRPDRLDPIGGAKVPRGVIASDVEIPKELMDSFIEHRAIRADRTSGMDMGEEELITPLLGMGIHDRKGDPVPFTFQRPNDDPLVPMPPLAHECLIRLHCSTE